MLSANLILQVIKQNTKLFLLVTIIAALGTFGATFLLKEKYKSVAVVFPVNIHQTSDESNTEQLLQYFLSEDTKFELAKKFNLFERYGIDTTTTKGGKSLFNYEFSEHVSIKPTLSESLEITVKDTDPKFAQQLNAELIKLTNLLLKESKTKIAKQYYENTRRALNRHFIEFDSLKKEIEKINLGIDVNKTTSDVEKKIIKENIKANFKSYAKLKQQSDIYLIDAVNNNDFVTVVSKPTLTDKRCYPLRSQFVIIACLGALLLTLIIKLIKANN